MADPAIRKVGCGVRVASATGIQKVFFDDSGIGIGYLLDIMNPMTVRAYSRVDALIRMVLFEQRHGHSMKVRNIGVEHIGG